jgi:lipopolysaccharide/colanic/teichoic acid biosynthesis glycosyltransferase
MQGLREGEDIEIVFTGLRPGEKLYEELHSDSERTRITRHERILVWELDTREEPALLAEVEELETIAQVGDSPAIKRQLHRLVPEYIEPHHEQQVPALAAPLVELVAAPAPAATPGPDWKERVRGVTEAVVAGALLVLSIPLWVLLGLEGRRRGVSQILVRENRLGRTRRRIQRRSVRENVAIDRRSFGRRTQDMLGEPMPCERFRSDLGPFSRWAARHRLGTVPFLFNVVRGEMALVGPVPEREETVLRWRDRVPDYERRFTVSPGVTGLAQIAGCDEKDPRGIERRIQYDLHYVDHRSLLLDLRTLLRTVVVILNAPRRATRVEPRTVPGSSAVKGVTQ